MEMIIGIGLFLAAVLFIEGVLIALRARYRPELRRARKRLRMLSSAPLGEGEVNIVRKRILSEVPWLNRLLLNITHVQPLDRLLRQANVRYPLGFYVLLTILLAFAGFSAASLITREYLIRMVVGVSLGAIPFFYVYSRMKKRLRKFELQLPDALGLIARALKAGHAFSSGLKMVEDEFTDPIGTEFGNTLDEINFGIGIPEALRNLAKRVPCPDLSFFAVAVIIQRETGGNLAEILESLSNLIRERFKFQGKIRVLSAEGRLSALVLVALPFVFLFYLLSTRPDYLRPLITDPAGRILIVLALFMMIVGIVIIRKLIRIKL